VLQVPSSFEESESREGGRGKANKHISNTYASKIMKIRGGFWGLDHELRYSIATEITKLFYLPLFLSTTP
jgi:hypothetical protein